MIFGFEAGRQVFYFEIHLSSVSLLPNFQMLLEAFSAYHDIRKWDDGSYVLVLLVC